MLNPNPIRCPDDSGDDRGLEDTSKIVADLPEYWREHYEERAAIREYEGGQTREQAEAEALRETIDLMNAGSKGVIPTLSNDGAEPSTSRMSTRS